MGILYGHTSKDNVSPATNLCQAISDDTNLVPRSMQPVISDPTYFLLFRAFFLDERTDRRCSTGIHLFVFLCAREIVNETTRGAMYDMN